MKTERPKPYIGVSGVIRGDQDGIMRQFEELQLNQTPYNRRLALGVKAVHKTQWLDTENKYGREWYPVGETEFVDALKPQGETLRVAQAYLDADYVYDPDYREAFMRRIAKRGKSWLNAIQFDLLPFTESSDLLPFMNQIKHDTGHATLLQAHSASMEQLGPKGLATLLGHYAHALDYVLFDASHGRGITLNAESLMPFLEEAYNTEALSSVGLAVAGGLSASTVSDKLTPIVAQYPGISWDAEGQLHPINGRGKRPLDTPSVNKYLEASRDILRDR